MWYDTYFLVCNASIRIVKSYPWRPFEHSMLFSIIASGISLTLSGLGGGLGAWRFSKEAGSESMWVAVVACAVLFVANLGAFAIKIAVACYRKSIEDVWMLESALTMEECLTYGNIVELNKVQITQWLICSC
jgi:hypothetical protein